MAEFKFEIVKHIATLSTNSKGWSKELNLVSWNERNAKYDIREWDPDHKMMSKGITLTKEELIELREGILDI
ncbi:MAG: YdbC family protein [Peptoniphilaceae bacterium]